MLVIRLSVIVLLQSVARTNSQVTPSDYLYTTSEVVSVNGSDVNGRCGFSHLVFGKLVYTNCTAPNTSVLFDGNVPTLTGLDGNMWASQLLTLKTTNSTAQLFFDFTTTPDYSRVEEVEVVMFNCPEWGISADSVSVSVDSTLSTATAPIVTTPTITSCDYLVRVCISVSTTKPVLRLDFSLPVDSDWMHLAEVKFYDDSGESIPDTSLITQTELRATSIAADTSATPIATNSTFATTPSTSSTSPTTVIIVVVVVIIILILITIVTITIVTLLLCKHFHIKHKDYRQRHSADSALTDTPQHTHTPGLSLCEETGQVYYSSPHHTLEEAAAASTSHHTYSHLQHHNRPKTRGHITHPPPGDTAALEEGGAYSTVSYSQQDPKLGQTKETATQDPLQLLYAQVDKNTKKKKTKDTVDGDGADVFPSALYSVVDKKEKKGASPAQPDTPVDQQYAQVDKKKRKKKEKEEEMELD